MCIDEIRRVLVVAPHADDESLGCGGTIARLSEQGSSITCILVTDASSSDKYSRADAESRRAEFDRATSILGISQTVRLGYPPARLTSDQLPKLIDQIFAVIESDSPNLILIPWFGDVHSDHQYVSQAAIAASKPFRTKSVCTVLMYEVLSETDQSVQMFTPNVFVDISNQIEKKLSAASSYLSELGRHPFPRSEESVKALATVRGASSNFRFAEAFEMVRSLIP